MIPATDVAGSFYQVEANTAGQAQYKRLRGAVYTTNQCYDSKGFDGFLYQRGNYGYNDEDEDVYSGVLAAL